MKYQLKAQNFLEWLALSTRQIPTPLIDISALPIQAKCIMLAVNLGITRSLGDKAKSPMEIAQECNLNPEVLTLILRVLVASNYLAAYKDGRFALTKQMQKLLLPNSKKSIENFILLGSIQWGHFEHLEEILKTGQGINLHKTFKNKDEWKVYQGAMLDMAKMLAKPVAKLVPVKKGASLILDVAGSHGLFGATICKKHGLEKCIVIDLPEAIEAAKPLTVETGIDDIVEFVPLDILEQPINIKSDVVFLGNILHHLNEKQIKSLLTQLKQNLTANGTLAILEISIDGEKLVPDLISAAMSLLFRVTSTAQCYTAKEYASWLDELGFREIKIKKILKSPSHRLIYGRV